MPRRVRKEVPVPRGKGNVITVERKVIGQGIVGKKVVGRKDKVLSKRERKTRIRTKGRARVKLRKWLQLRKMIRMKNRRKRRKPGWQW